MTRKKFVKQLMAMGYSRNQAEATANSCTIMGASYERAMEWVVIGYRSREYLNATGAHLREMMQPAIEAVAEIVRKYTEALSAIDWETVGEHVAELAATADNAAAVHQEDALDALSYAADALAGGGGIE